MIFISICFWKKFRNELCKMSKQTFSYQTPQMAASGFN